MEQTSFNSMWPPWLIDFPIPVPFPHSFPLRPSPLERLALRSSLHLGHLGFVHCGEISLVREKRDRKQWYMKAEQHFQLCFSNFFLFLSSFCSAVIENYHFRTINYNICRRNIYQAFSLPSQWATPNDIALELSNHVYE